MEGTYYEHQLESAPEKRPVLAGRCVGCNYGCVLHPRPVRGRAGDHRQPDHRGRAAAADYPAAIGIISDPTTKGVKDSQLAMTYDAPKDDGKKVE